MKDLSVSQEYLLCALNSRGKFSSFSTEQPVCFVAAALIELLFNDFVRMQDKKIVISRKLEEEFDYLSPMVEVIQNSKPKRITGIVDVYSFSLTNKNLNALMQSVGGALVPAGCATEKSRTGFLTGTRKYIIPVKECTDNVIQKIRAELLEDGEISDETVALTALLNKAGLLRQYFSAYEVKDLKKRLKEIKDSAPNKMIQEMLDYVDSVMAAIFAASMMAN